MHSIVIKTSVMAGLALAMVGCVSSPRFTSEKYSRSTGADFLMVEEGVASFYADEFHGRTTSNGETYDMNQMTAAHPSLPFNSRVRVTNVSNGKSVIVRINDRGPFKGGRIIDLSLAAAKALGMIGRGTADVRVEVIELGDARAGK